MQIKTCDLFWGDGISVAPTLPATFYLRSGPESQREMRDEIFSTTEWSVVENV